MTSHSENYESLEKTCQEWNRMYDEKAAQVRKLEEALRSIRDFRAEENEWDGVDVCMPAMRKIAQDALVPGAVARLAAMTPSQRSGGT